MRLLWWSGRIMFGLHAGDAMLFRLTGPAGEVLTERSVIEKPQAQAFRAVGRQVEDGGLACRALSGRG